MKAVICGVGRVARHLLKRLGRNWEIILIDRVQERMNELVQRFPVIQRTVAGDASSPVLLDEIGLGEADYVLALTDNDKVNLAVCRYARDQGVKHILAVVRDEENNQDFQDACAHTLTGNAYLAKHIFHYLQDPRINVVSLSLGPGEIMELDVADHFRLVGAEASTLMTNGYRLVALFRGEEMVFAEPDLVIEDGDRLLILGKPDIYPEVCGFLRCGQPHFPLAYGQSLLVALAAGQDHRDMFEEALHLGRNIRLRDLVLLCQEEEEGADRSKGWPQGIDICVERAAGGLRESILEEVGKRNYGLVMMGPMEASFMKSLAKPFLISLAHALPCPLLISRHSQPYERILVPFGDSPRAELALAVAFDLAQQLKAEVTVTPVEEPEFLHGGTPGEWSAARLERAREIAHIHKVDFEGRVLSGNPVKELTTLSETFQLMVLGSTSKEKSLLAPHVGELLAQRSACSVLIIAN